MRNRILTTLCLVLLACTGCRHGQTLPETARMTPVDFSKVRIDDSFWAPRLERHHDVTMPVCIDQIENRTHRIANFANVPVKGEYRGIFFDDSDVYKALEGMACSLVNRPDSAIEAVCRDWIAKIAGAQQEDGYINTFYTIAVPGERWTDMDRHEMYCAGHLTEAAVAWFQATGERDLLDVAIRMAEHMMSVFGPGKRDWVPGHEEIELALVKLADLTGEKKYLDFALWLLEERGKGFGFYGGHPATEEQRRYYQDDVPVDRLRDISGHAVRAMYLYSAMADVNDRIGDGRYDTALDSLWDDVVNRNMYVTGGIGQSASNEGFTRDYDLPNLTAYCETCASVGMVLWNARMNRMRGHARYADVVERAMYNGALAGISLAGDRFFYVNPLESLGDHHRQSWYGCACCPSQICRFLPSIGNYVYGTSEHAMWVNLYIGGSVRIYDGVTLTQETDYPWSGMVKLTVSTDRKLDKTLRLRIPYWCRAFTVRVNGEERPYLSHLGYAALFGPWSDGDEIELDMEMPAYKAFAPPQVAEDRGKCFIRRGPLVYCLEEVDNPGLYATARLTPDTVLQEEFCPDLLGGVVKITATEGDRTYTFVPYYAWDNREAGGMKVWVDYDEDR